MAVASETICFDGLLYFGLRGMGAQSFEGAQSADYADLLPRMALGSSLAEDTLLSMTVEHPQLEAASYGVEDGMAQRKCVQGKVPK
jgi:hypothetical protein